MGQKSKNAGKKKSKPSSDRLATSKSVSGNVPRSHRQTMDINNYQMYEKLGLNPVYDKGSIKNVALPIILGEF